MPRQRDQSRGSAGEEWIGENVKSTGACSRDGHETRVEFTFGIDVKNLDLLSDLGCCRHQLCNLILGAHADRLEHGDQLRFRCQLAQQFQSFRGQCWGDIEHAGGVTARPTKALD